MDNTVNILVASRYDEERNCILTKLSEIKDFSIAGIGKDETSAIIKSEQLKPNILILDLQLSDINGPDLIRIIRARSPSTAIIILHAEGDMDSIGILACLTIKTGISGFLLKKTDFDKLIIVVKLVFSGGYYISASIIVKISNMITFSTQFPGQAAEENHTIFTPTERGIILSLANGLQDSQIAQHLNLSRGTIKNCLTVIKRKLNLKPCANRMQIAVHSITFGLIRLEQLDIYKNNGQFLNDTIQ
jgi:DNA-binding NarL/FixJ family response regulator